MTEQQEQKPESAQEWLDQLRMRENDSAEKAWETRGEKIVKRYRDERSAHDDSAGFNILWSNVETIFPATYARPPKAEVSRRNKDSNPVARTAARILERAIQYEIDQYPDFDESVRAAILDRLLCGRGTVWVRFEQNEVARPAGEQEQQEREADPMLMLPPSPEQPTPSEIKEHACVDYVYWKDFRHGEARTWTDVPWVARREYLDRKAGIERFGDTFKDVPLSHEPIGIDDDMRSAGRDGSLKKAAVWEIWHKQTKTAIWVAEGFESILDSRPDPYGLEGFFPCPKPLFATQTTDRITPVPDFSLYQDQAKELDLLTARINGLTKALRLVGAYDGSNQALATLLSQPDNTLVPVENWAQLSERGGIGGVISWVPLKDVVAALQAAYNAREQAKQVVYEITGISDIIRGATKASETATAQNIKRQFGSLRLQNRQRDVAVFCTEIMRIKSQLMCDVYSPETLVAMSGIDGTEDAQYLDEALTMLQTEPLREYVITVAADSLVAIDEEQEKAQRMEFLSAVGGFIQQAMQASQTTPEIAPLAMEMLMFAVRAFPAAKPIEGSFEQFQQAMQNKPPQDPNAGAQAQQHAEMQKLQQHMQIEQMKLQAESQTQQVRAQADIQVQQSRLQMQAQLEQQRAQMQAEVDRYRADVDAQSKAAIAQMQMEFQRWKAELDAAVKIQVANIGSKDKIDNPATQAATREIAQEVRQ